MEFKPQHRYDFSLLPSHVIAIILKNLNFRQRLDAGRTCKSWYFASCDPMISRDICIRIWRKFEYPLTELNRPFGRLLVQEINFNTFEFNEFLAKFGTHIVEIDFDLCHISMSQLLDCLAHLTNLSTFKIKPRGRTFARHIEFNGTHNTVAVRTNLNRVKCFGVVLDAPDAGGLQFLMRMMPNLRTIYFSPVEFCGQYIFKTLFNYIDERGDFLNLSELEIGDSFFAPSWEFFVDFGKIRRALNIQKLTLGIRTQSTDRNCDRQFDDFCQKLSNLRALVMFSINQCELVSICRHMTKLTMLKLWDKGIDDVRIIGKLQHLEKLQLNVDVFRVACDEESLAEMFTPLEHLKELHLNRYPVSRRVLKSICANCKQLTRLHLTNLKTNNLQTMFKNLVKLKTLQLVFAVNQSCTTVSVSFDITNLELLEVLQISGFAPGMTLRLIEKLPNLKMSSLEQIRKMRFIK